MIRGTTRLAAVIGWPIEHSRSPEMLNAAFAAAKIDAVMVPLGVPPAGFSAALAGLRVTRALGASVTIPHKLAAAAACDRLAPEARAIGAVNCLQLADGVLVGHNTDCDGFVDGLRAAGCADPRHVVLLGAGGAARAVAYGLRHADTLEVIARAPARVDWVWRSADPIDRAHGTRETTPAVHAWTDANLRSAFSRADLVVDCTSIALHDDEATVVDALPVEALAATAWVATLVYHRPARLLERARALGLATVDGRGMLVHQGARAFTIWTGVPAPIDAMHRALDDALRTQAT